MARPPRRRRAAEAAANEDEGGEEHDGAGGDPAAPRPSPPMDGVSEALGLLEEMLALASRPRGDRLDLIGGCFDRDNATAARLAAAAVRLPRTRCPTREPAAHRVRDDRGLCRPPRPAHRRRRRRDRRRRRRDGLARSRSRLSEALKLFVSGCAAEEGGDGAAAAAGRRCGPTPARATHLAALVSSGETASAERVLSAMERGAAEPPNAYSLCIMMRARGGRRALAPAQAMWQRLCERQWVDTVALNTWLQVCMACGEQRRAMQAFQLAKSDMPSGSVRPDRVTFGTLINGLCTPSSSRSAARRALQLWAEMRDNDIAPDDGMVAASCARASATSRWRSPAAAARAPRTRWSEKRLRAHDAWLVEALPSLTEVMQEPSKWRALGVRPSTGIASEQAQLSLVLPRRARDASARGAANGGRAGVQGEEGAAEDDDEDGIADDDDGMGPAAASISQEIWERKGWNEIDGGWRGFF